MTLAQYIVMEDITSRVSACLVSHFAVTNRSCTDKTSVGVWKLARAATSSSSSSLHSIPNNRIFLTKIIASKLLVLDDEKTRQDYLKQQSDFVTKTTAAIGGNGSQQQQQQHGESYRNIEFTTDIQGKSPTFVRATLVGLKCCLT